MSIQEALLNQDLDFEAAIADAHEIESAGLDLELFKDSRLDSLKGVPFLIVGGTYREKFIDGKVTDFVTAVAVIANEETLKKRHVRYTGNEPWFPLQTFGMNDGSTGIRRQLTSILHNQGHIEVIEPGSVVVESGSLGECSYDLKVSQWHEIKIGDLSQKKDKATGQDLTIWDFGLEKGIYCPRGIRTSTYKGRYGKDVTTRYLA